MKTDLLLIFPPQWSPFQPPLGVAALAAWMTRSGHSVKILDLNVEFYHWLFSDTACEIATEQLASNSSVSTKSRRRIAAFLRAAPRFRRCVEGFPTILARDDHPTPSRILAETYVFNRILENWCAAISAACSDFAISPYYFSVTGNALSVGALEAALCSPPRFIAAFIHDRVLPFLKEMSPLVVGLSCIGQDQLYWTLLLGAAARRHSQCPVVVGGTITSRIYERGRLPRDWLGRYFDFMVRNEGERPLDAFLSRVKSGSHDASDIPGFVSGETACAPAPPLHPRDVPTPMFDGLPLEKYFTPEVTLPLLTSRGCYWGKCEFCHHGMIYGEKYASAEVENVLRDVTALSLRHSTRAFAFNDEAIPPKIFRGIGSSFPQFSESGWRFTGLLKFERYYQDADFKAAFNVGFRTLYVGLESASEKVLALMKKNCSRSTMLDNLRSAAKAGIWMHCFLFFGFPGETEVDAQETFDFILANLAVIPSHGCGVFSFEHGAPISRHPNRLGIVPVEASPDDLNVYLPYAVPNGIDEHRAAEWQRLLFDAACEDSRYLATRWISSEHLLCLVSALGRDGLVEEAQKMRLGQLLD